MARYTDQEVIEQETRYQRMAKAEFGRTLPCPICEKPTAKDKPKKKFCGKECRLTYNRITAKRLQKIGKPPTRLIDHPYFDPFRAAEYESC